ncbi:hypothetical protein IKW73_00190 [Candidatus Saccharibacteria bacterium]|nr:hypothetical protein [Candidatus Saccharibacteria bacterium]
MVVVLFYSVVVVVLYAAIIGGVIFILKAKALGIPVIIAVLVVLGVIAFDVGSACLFGFYKGKKDYEDTEETGVEERIKADLANDPLCNHNTK